MFLIVSIVLSCLVLLILSCLALPNVIAIHAGKVLLHLVADDTRKSL